MPVKERSDPAEFLTASTRTSGGCVRGSVEDVASVHAAKTKGNTPTRATNGTPQRCSIVSQESAMSAFIKTPPAHRGGDPFGRRRRPGQQAQICAESAGGSRAHRRHIGVSAAPRSQL